MLEAPFRMVMREWRAERTERDERWRARFDALRERERPAIAAEDERVACERSAACERAKRERSEQREQHLRNKRECEERACDERFERAFERQGGARFERASERGEREHAYMYVTPRSAHVMARSAMQLGYVTDLRPEFERLYRPNSVRRSIGPLRTYRVRRFIGPVRNSADLRSVGARQNASARDHFMRRHEHGVEHEAVLSNMLRRWTAS